MSPYICPYLISQHINGGISAKTRANFFYPSFVDLPYNGLSYDYLVG